jgi:hypothetical protein
MKLLEQSPHLDHLHQDLKLVIALALVFSSIPVENAKTVSMVYNSIAWRE